MTLVHTTGPSEGTYPLWVQLCSGCGVSVTRFPDGWQKGDPDPRPWPVGIHVVMYGDGLYAYDGTPPHGASDDSDVYVMCTGGSYAGVNAPDIRRPDDRL